jgi:hypothetical protein
MPSAKIRKLRPPLSQSFGGLWLCRKPIETDTVIEAILFMRGKDLDYMLKWEFENLELTDLDGGEHDIFTHPWLMEISVTPTSLREHHAGYVDDSDDTDFAWKAGLDGSLSLDDGKNHRVFYPTTFAELYRLGFERDIVEGTLEQVEEELGKLEYQLEPRLPVFPR